MIPIVPVPNVLPVFLLAISCFVFGLEFLAFWLRLYKRGVGDPVAGHVLLLSYVGSSWCWVPLLMVCMLLAMGAAEGDAFPGAVVALVPGIVGSGLVCWATRSSRPTLAAVLGAILGGGISALCPATISCTAAPEMWVCITLIGSVWDPERRMRLKPQWLCGACGCDLRGLTSVICAECGTQRTT